MQSKQQQQRDWTTQTTKHRLSLTLERCFNIFIAVQKVNFDRLI